jgi:multidrug resistance efflux pump
MRMIFLALLALLLSLPVGIQHSSQAQDGTNSSSAAQSPTTMPFEVEGKTRPIPRARAEIAPTVLHPVVEVLVVPGDRVKKDQPLVKLDSDEPEAEVRGKKAALEEMKASLARLKGEPRKEEQEEARANLENFRVTSEHTRELLARMEPLWRKGAISEQRYHEVRCGLAKSEADERAARQRLDRLLKRPFALEVAELEARIVAAAEAVKAAEAELEHYTVTAAIDGIVASLEVSPGTVARPGTTVWGEILDLRKIDVSCELPPQQADSLTLGQRAGVVVDSRPDQRWVGQVAFIGVAADLKTGRVPVRVRIDNAEERLRCYVEVKVRFGNGGPQAQKR